jgi:hypothetical protein
LLPILVGTWVAVSLTQQKQELRKQAATGLDPMAECPAPTTLLAASSIDLSGRCYVSVSWDNVAGVNKYEFKLEPGQTYTVDTSTGDRTTYQIINADVTPGTYTASVRVSESDECTPQDQWASIPITFESCINAVAATPTPTSGPPIVSTPTPTAPPAATSTPIPTLTPTPEINSCDDLTADINGDGIVGEADRTTIFYKIFRSCDGCQEDIWGPNGAKDNKVDIWDYSKLAEQWGQACTPTSTPLPNP